MAAAEAIETLGPAIIVHNLNHAVAALLAAASNGPRITLLSAPQAGVYAGAPWFCSVVELARERAGQPLCSAVLDCGADAGAVQTAIHEGIDAVVFTGSGDVALRLTEIARENRVLVLDQPLPALLDLGAEFFASHDRLFQRCTDALATNAGF